MTIYNIKPHQLNSLVLKQTTPLEIDKLIKALPNKSSHGHDQISIMLKSLRMSITFPLCHIFNQSIYDTLFSSQYGFRSRHSCEEAILEFVSHILQAKNRGEHIASVFLDLSKAFDTLDHKILLSKLERYGVRGVALKWFENYLEGKSLIAKVTTSTNQISYSDSFDITYGTSQGLCLGPLLFIIFVNDSHLLPL